MTRNKKAPLWPWVLALVLCGMLGRISWDSHVLMKAKLQEQEQVLESFSSWKADYEKLLPIQERWERDSKSLADAKDLYSVSRMLGTELQFNEDTLVVDKVSRVVVNEMDLKAMRVCLSSGSGTSFEVYAESVPALLRGLEALLQRSDIETESVQIGVRDVKATARLTPLCVILREEEDSKKAEGQP